MANINNTVLSGSIAMDPDLRWIAEDGETGITRLGLIVKKSRKLPEPLEDGTEWEETSSIFDVDVYGAFALTIARKLQKFDDVTVSGELVKEEWEDKDGGKRSRIKISAKAIDSPGLFRKKAEDRDLRTLTPATQTNGRQQQQTIQQPPAAAPAPAPAAPAAAESSGREEVAAELTADDIPF
jgi:single stranded DNA-binding protein